MSLFTTMKRILAIFFSRSFIKNFTIKTIFSLKKKMTLNAMKWKETFVVRINKTEFLLQIRHRITFEIKTSHHLHFIYIYKNKIYIFWFTSTNNKNISKARKIFTLHTNPFQKFPSSVSSNIHFCYYKCDSVINSAKIFLEEYPVIRKRYQTNHSKTSRF